MYDISQNSKVLRRLLATIDGVLGNPEYVSNTCLYLSFDQYTATMDGSWQLGGYNYRTQNSNIVSVYLKLSGRLPIVG